MKITTVRVNWALLFIASLLMIIWAGTLWFPAFVGAVILAAIAHISFVIMETRARKRNIEEALLRSEAYKLIVETELFLMRKRAEELGVFICPTCGWYSYNKNDLEEGYCGRCHAFTGDRPDEI